VTAKHTRRNRLLILHNVIASNARTGFVGEYHICFGPIYSSPYSDFLRAGWSGDRFLVGRRFSVSVQIEPGGEETFHICPNRTWCLPSPLYNVYQVSFRGVEQQGHGIDHPRLLAPRLKKEHSWVY